MLAAVFLAGVLSGGIGMRVWTSKTTPPVDPVLAQSQLALRQLSSELELKPGQVGQVQTILDHYIMLEADLMSQMRSLQNQGRAEILKVLDQQQRSKFEEMVQHTSN